MNLMTIIADAGISDRYDLVKEWYDGYLFGRTEMYCPWDVLRFVGDVLNWSYSEALGSKSYWVNTSETSLEIIKGFLGKVRNVTEDFERLLAGETIDCTVNDNLPYHRIHDSGENIWSALVETGYGRSDLIITDSSRNRCMILLGEKGMSRKI